MRWSVAAAVAAGSLAALAWLFRLPVAPPALRLPQPMPAPAADRPKPFAQLVNSATTDPVLAQELALRDMRPLFLPTERINASLPEPRREPGRTFLDDDSLKWSFGEAEISIARDLPPIVSVNGKAPENATPTDALAADMAGSAMQGFGRGRPEIAPMAPRGGFVEAISTATGHVVLAETLPPEARAPGDKPWEPMEFLVTVDAAGLAAPLIVTTSSRVEEVDAHYRNLLARRYRIGERLPPGFYRIVVGP